MRGQARLRRRGGGGNWSADANTWTYSSADAPTFVISINADMTAMLTVGCKIKLTQTTVKYFIVTVVGAYSGGVTLVTVYGGTDYTLANAAISSPNYSYAKSPTGFPMSPVKWTVELSDNTDRSQSSPVSGTWYNINSNTITIPIGTWEVDYQIVMFGVGSVPNVWSTLSTANNSESDVDFTVFVAAAATSVYSSANRRKTLTVGIQNGILLKFQNKRHRYIVRL